MKTYVYQSEILIQAPLTEVFEFFSQAENLGRLTPPHLAFEILTPMPIEMRAGTMIAYRIKLFGVPFKWLTEITVWEPGLRFYDVQRKGPYAKWEHEHLFTAEGNATCMRDTVHYAVPGWVLAPLVNLLFVGPQIKKIFAYRTEAIQAKFPAVAKG